MLAVRMELCSNQVVERTCHQSARFWLAWADGPMVQDFDISIEQVAHHQRSADSRR